jgi:hypothetical protein
MKTSKYTIKATIARDKNLPTSFVAVELRRTDRGGLYLFGHGVSDPESGCVRCGRRLTHPGSILLGIGPECLGDWGMRDMVLDNITEADIKRLQDFVWEMTVDNWLPAWAINSVEDTEEMVEVPAWHKMLGGNGTPPAAGETPKEPPKSVRTGTLDSSGKFIQIRFPYEPAMVENVRSLEGRKWNPDGKFWSAWASLDNLSKLQGFGFELDAACLQILNPAPVEEVKITSNDLNIPGLYPFQLEGVKFLESKNGNALIGDEMGLGKTIQVLGWLKFHPELRPAVVVVPASLKINWQREAEKWLGKDCGAVILSGTKPNPLLLGKINIINYDILAPWLPELKKASPQVMVVDESHYIKSPKARRTKAVKELGKACAHTIFLSGTPITNRPSEFFTVLNMLSPTEFNSWIRFTQKYCGAYNNGFGWDISGATNTADLHERLNNKIMLRRLKADVLKDLPAKRRMVVPMDISNRKDYNVADADLIGWLKETFGAGKASSAAQAEALARFNYLKQLAAEGKRQMALQWIQDSLDANGKLVLMVVHHTMIDFLAEELRNYNPVVVDGRVSQENRQKAVDRFQNDPECRLFIGNIKAAGVGLTLTASSNVVFLELGWTPGEMEQAADRVHRIGQESSSVNVWYLVAHNTIEEEIAEILDSKLQVLNAVLDGKETTDEGTLIRELLKKRLEV